MVESSSRMRAKNQTQRVSNSSTANKENVTPQVTNTPSGILSDEVRFIVKAHEIPMQNKAISSSKRNGKSTRG